MPTLTLADHTDTFIINPIGRFLLVMILLLCNSAVTYLLCLAYRHRKGLPSLERPAFGDREAEGRVVWQILTMKTAADMSAGLKFSLRLNRLLLVALALCVLTIAISLFTGH